MKNKIYYIVLSLFCMFSFMNNVFAADVTISTELDKTEFYKGETLNVKLNVKTVDSFIGCKVYVTPEDGIVDGTFLGANGMSLLAGDGGFTVTTNDSNLGGVDATNGLTVAQLTYKVNASGKVKIEVDHCTIVDENGNLVNVDNVQGTEFSVTAVDLSTVTTLKTLSINGKPVETFTPDNAELTHYAVNVESSTFSIEATATNPDYNDDIVITDGDGNKLDAANIKFSDSSGQGKMAITLTVNNGTKYNLIVSYEQKEFDNSLASLKINGVSVNLVKGQYRYDDVSLPAGATSIKVEATLTDSNNFSFDDGNLTFNYEYGVDTKTISIAIIPKDASSGAKRADYTINIKSNGSELPPDSDEPSKSSSSSSSKPGDDNIGSNPGTGNAISMFLMALVLVSSLVGSIVLYQKNLESYK